MRAIVYTTHARQRMALRKITGEMVQQAIDAPDETGTGYQARLLAYRRFPPGRIKVVYVEKSQETVVITVIWEG